MDIQDVENLATLARIELSQEEKEDILKDMEGILAYVKQVEGVEVDDVKTDPFLYNVFREDDPDYVKRDFSADDIKKQFPDSQDGFLKVKKIL